MSSEDRTRTDGMAQGASAVATTSREEARDVAETAKSQAQDVLSTARDEAQQLTDAAKDRAQDVFANVRDEVRQRADEQSSRAAQALHDTSGQLRRMAGAADGGMLVDLAQSAASRVDDVATRIDHGGFDAVLDDVRSYARRRPGMFLMMAGAAGFVVGRLARNASSAMSASPSPSPQPMARPQQPPIPTAMARPAEDSDFVGAGTPSITWPEP